MKKIYIILTLLLLGVLISYNNWLIDNTIEGNNILNDNYKIEGNIENFKFLKASNKGNFN